MASPGSDVALGVAAGGDDERLRRGARAATKLRDAWRVILHGQVRKVDLACANRQYFVQLAGVGLDGAGGEEITWDMSGWRSHHLHSPEIARDIAPRCPCAGRRARRGRRRSGTERSGRSFQKARPIDRRTLDVFPSSHEAARLRAPFALRA